MNKTEEQMFIFSNVRNFESDRTNQFEAVTLLGVKPTALLSRMDK
jgi:hypothetical protein